MPKTRPLGYGIDSPLTLTGLMAGGVASAVTGYLFYVLSSSPRLAVLRFATGAFLLFFGALLLVLGASLFFTSSLARHREARGMIRDLLLGGNELVLDVECGRGHFAVPAAKRLGTGAVVGLDTWNPRRVTGNSPWSLSANALAEGVSDRLRAVKGSPSLMPFADSTFDVAATCLGFPRAGRHEVDGVVSEMARVLKPGGRLAVLFTGYGRTSPGLFESLGLTEVRISNLRLGVFPGAQRVIARKPVSPRPKVYPR